MMLEENCFPTWKILILTLKNNIFKYYIKVKGKNYEN